MRMAEFVYVAYDIGAQMPWSNFAEEGAQEGGFSCTEESGEENQRT